MSKKTVVILGIAVAAGLVVVGVIVVKILSTNGGTPIIIKGFGDTDGDVAITGSPSPDSGSQTSTGQTNHSRVSEWIYRLFVLDGTGKCVAYAFGNSDTTEISLDVKGVKKEIYFTNSLALKKLVLTFDDVNTYQKSGDYYKRKLPGVIEKVNVTSDPGTQCTDQNDQTIKCPTEFSGTGPLTIAVNYDTKVCQKIP